MSADTLQPPPRGLRDRLYKDSTPRLRVGNSAFEDWFQQQPFALVAGVKQMCRDSYAAGMGDPLVTYAQPQHNGRWPLLNPAQCKIIAGLSQADLLDYVMCSPEVLTDGYYSEFRRAIWARYNELRGNEEWPSTALTSSRS